MKIKISNLSEMIKLSSIIGKKIYPPMVIELQGDIGAGKTTFVKGLADGLGIKEDIKSPSFTINRLYKINQNDYLSHFDLYRLNDLGIIKDELSETINNDNTITVIEWSGIANNLLPKDRLVIKFKVVSENERELEISDNLSDNLTSTLRDNFLCI